MGTGTCRALLVSWSSGLEVSWLELRMERFALAGREVSVGLVEPGRGLGDESPVQFSLLCLWGQAGQVVTDALSEVC